MTMGERVLSGLLPLPPGLRRVSEAMLRLKDNTTFHAKDVRLLLAEDGFQKVESWGQGKYLVESYTNHRR